ncbi:MAG TPA: protoporphyrinogen oxidase [Candidatus Xenobia bacterium]|nr:protoporphyrinogen oxidase [Candidatus Xenobia bacterium]
MSAKRIVVIGGGISGLAAACDLSKARRAGGSLEEYLVEASPRLGGAILTEQVRGCIVEAGADSFLTEKREAAQLCEELGLGSDLIGSNDSQRKTYILHRGRLEALPEGLEFFLPVRVGSILGTSLLSWRDKLAAALETFQRPRSRPDESVASFVERHFSRGLLENIVDPLLNAVYGGDPAQLSARAVLPRMVEMEARYGSLTRAMRKRKRPTGDGARPPLFTTLRSGLATLVSALEAQLDPTRVFRGKHVTGLEKSATGYRLRLGSTEALEAEGVILALPAHESARLLRPLDPILAESLNGIPYSSSLIVAVGYDAAQVRRLPQGFGLLVPRKEPTRLCACTFLDQKFPQRAPPGRLLLRCFYGGTRDEGAVSLSDADVQQVVRADLRTILGITAEPLFVKVYRWPKAIAQYTVGHLERVAVIRARLAQHSGVFLAGNALDGIGVSDCIASGRVAARAAV